MSSDLIGLQESTILNIDEFSCLSDCELFCE